LREARLSPDGRYLAYSTWPENNVNTVKILDLYQKAGGRSIHDGAGIKGGLWFLGDNRLVFTQYLPRPAQAFVVQPAIGVPPEQILNGPISHAASSGRWLLVGIDLPGRLGMVAVVDTLSQRKALILDPGPERLVAPRLSPDEKWVAFVLQGGATARPRIFVAPFLGLDPVPRDRWTAITTGEVLDEAPEWSPDSESVYFLSDRDDGHRCIWAQGVRAGKMRGPAIAVRHCHVFEERSGLRGVEAGDQMLSAVKGNLSMLVNVGTSDAGYAELPRTMR
jgi:hypothetical protein